MIKAIRIILIAVIAVMVVTLGVAAYQAIDGADRMTVQLNGDQKVYVEYGQTYVEPGADVLLRNGDKAVDIPVQIQGGVDTERIGLYRIKYTARSGDRVSTAYRNVYVVDTQKPVITLKENPGSFTLINEPYIEEGFTATDNYDGDLTSQVIRREADGVVTYTVTDSYGNTASVVRTINYIDPGIPNIQFVGGQFAFIMVGDNYEEPGYTAMDTVDGDITASVVVSGAVDNLTSGVYTLNYVVSNSLGSTTTKERTVYVIPRQTEEEEPDRDENNTDDFPEIDIPTGGTTIIPNGKTIYLTFDDGPSSHTSRLLDVLAKYGVKATFFVVNKSDMSMVTRAANEGHSIAIHAYRHNYNEIYASDEAFFNDFYAMQDVIYQHTGQRTVLCRFPGGSSNTVSSAYNKGIMTRLAKELEARGFQYFDWNVDSKDAGGAKTSEEVFKNVTEGVAKRNNSVVLQHDTQSFSVDAVEAIIAWGLCNGYTFQPLTYDSPTCHHGISN